MKNKTSYFKVGAILLFTLISVFGIGIFAQNSSTVSGKAKASAQEPADINSDNKVDIFDLSTLLSKWGTNTATSDLNSDGTVNIFDLSMLLSKWGSVAVTDLSLPRIPWEGGSSYWSQFAKANAAGWDDPSFFPITVFMGNPEHAAELKALGINTFAPMEHRTDAISYIDNTPGMFMLPGGEWTTAEIGNRANAVGWFISDECEMGYSGCDGADQYAVLAQQQVLVAARKNLNDDRFLMANFGNGILRTFWAPDTMDEHVRLMDASSADKYTYTSPHIWGLVPDSPDWPTGATVATAASYGWQADQMKRFQDPANLRPIWTFVETARPILTEPGALTITPD